MPQLDFSVNLLPGPTGVRQFQFGTFYCFSWSPTDSISLLSVNIMYSQTNAGTFTVSLGLYSVNGSTLSLANSLSATKSNTGGAQYMSFTATSQTQNITPGQWYWGYVVTSAGGNSVAGFIGNQAFGNSVPTNTIPNFFVGGRMTVSTAGLPSNVAITDIDASISTSGISVFPTIILTA